MVEELAAQGFEIVTDETGQELVKLMFMDENNESSGYALVSLEDAKKIMNGEATLQNVTDEEGEQVLTLVPVDQEGTTAAVSRQYCRYLEVECIFVFSRGLKIKIIITYVIYFSLSYRILRSNFVERLLDACYLL